MARYGSFRKVNFQIEMARGYGQYIITGKYRGQSIKAHTTNSEVWDWINDYSNKKKHTEARRYCYEKIVEEYEK